LTGDWLAMPTVAAVWIFSKRRGTAAKCVGLASLRSSSSDAGSRCQKTSVAPISMVNI
jgi:hypothetical protein